jgi:hypothetical protein
MRVAEDVAKGVVGDVPTTPRGCFLLRACLDMIYLALRINKPTENSKLAPATSDAAGKSQNTPKTTISGSLTYDVSARCAGVMKGVR